MSVYVVAQTAASHDRRGIHKQTSHLATLLCSYLKHTARFFHNWLDEFAFGNGQRQRFFTIDISPRSHCVNRNRHVPMIRSTDNDNIRFFVFKQLAIVGVLVELSTHLFVVFSSM